MTLSLSLHQLHSQEIKMYLNIGVGIEFVRNAIKYSNLFKSRPFAGFWKCISSINENFVLFAVAYPCSYRVRDWRHLLLSITFNFICFDSQMLMCLFNNFIDCDSSVANFVSAFTSGIFFYFYPNIPLFAHTLSCAVQITWQRLLEMKSSELHPIISQMNKLPIAGLIYTFGFAYLNHVRTFYPYASPPFLKKAVNYGSDGL